MIHGCGNIQSSTEEQLEEGKQWPLNSKCCPCYLRGSWPIVASPLPRKRTQDTRPLSSELEPGRAVAICWANGVTWHLSRLQIQKWLHVRIIIRGEGSEASGKAGREPKLKETWGLYSCLWKYRALKHGTYILARSPCWKIMTAIYWVPIILGASHTLFLK